MKMGGKRKKKDIVNYIELPHEEIIKMIYNSEKSIETLAKESNISVEKIKIILKEYHNALDLRMEQFKEEISKTKNIFLEAKEGLKLLISQMPDIECSEPIRRNYCEVFDGEKWVGSPKKLGSKSFIIQKK